MDVRVGLWTKLSAKELMLLNCGVGEDSWGSLGLQGDPTSPFWRRSALGFLWKERYDKPRQHIKKQRYYFANKGPSSQSYGFSSGHVWMWDLDQKDGWAPKNWCFWTVVLKKTLECLLDCKEIKPVNPKGNQPWIFTGRTDVEAEAPILWPPDAKNWLIGKSLMLGKIKGRSRRGQQRMRWLDGITDSIDMLLLLLLLLSHFSCVWLCVTP